MEKVPLVFSMKKRYSVNESDEGIVGAFNMQPKAI